MENKYHDPRWQKFRLKRLEQSKWSCDHCGDSKIKLNIHHAFYIARRDPWHYLPQSTIVLCDQCHEDAHDYNSSIRPDDIKWTEWEIWAAVKIAEAVERSRKRIKLKRKAQASVR